MLMKKHIAPILVSIVGIFWFIQSAQADYTYTTDFSVPPYELDETIVGQQGWQNFGTHAPASSSMIVEVPWNSDQSALRLTQLEGATSRIRVYDSSIVPAEFTGTLSITTSMAFTGLSTSEVSAAVTSINFENTYAAVTPISFGLDHRSTGGLYYAGDGGRIIILSRDDIKEGSFYEFSLTIDTVAKLFDIQVTGVKNDDTIFNYSLANIAAGTGNFKGFYVESALLSNTGVETYIGIGNVIPEPTTAALILGTAFSFLLLRRRK